MYGFLSHPGQAPYLFQIEDGWDLLMMELVFGFAAEVSLNKVETTCISHCNEYAY